MTVDAILTRDPASGLYDIGLDVNGDIASADFFDTAILYSLFGERRASSSEVVEPQFRRGWIGNDEAFENGSKLWLFTQARLTRTNLNRIEDEARKALKWIVDDGLAISVDEVSTNLVGGRPRLNVTIRRSRDRVERRSFDLWESTGRAT